MFAALDRDFGHSETMDGLKSIVDPQRMEYWDQPLEVRGPSTQGVRTEPLLLLGTNQGRLSHRTISTDF